MSVEVKVCVCTECVMNGAMDLVESVESLKKLRSQLGYDYSLKLDLVKCLAEPRHGADSPLVSVEGELIRSANSERVMEQILAIVKKDGTLG